MNMKLKEIVIDVLSESGKSMHVNDIAAAAVAKYPNLPDLPDQLAAKISAMLSVEVKKPKSQSLFSKPKNKAGGFRKGMYRLRIGRKSVPKKFKVPEQPKVSSQFTGKAGEYAVMSELLFFGFNVSAMTVDDGIDIVASKGDSYFHIQVKTANVTANNKFQFKITKRAFESKDAAATFYVLVLRISDNSRNVCEYLILPSSEIRKLADKGVVREGESMTLSVNRERGNRFILNSTEDVTWSLNRFDNVK
ncbi:MAG TPA: hypothetical protein VN693_01090 [Rhodanobacteraceae bacterium]|nr:hypothetical protein [Rhodanobacteraceae bacterium]